MRNKLSCFLKECYENENQYVFSIYEIDDKLHDYHKVLLNQSISKDEIKEVIFDLEDMVSRIKHSYLYFSAEKHECKWCAGAGYLSGGLEQQQEQCRECEGRGFFVAFSDDGLSKYCPVSGIKIDAK